MNPTLDPVSAEEDPRLLRAVQEYLSELEAGRRPSRSDLAARHPDLIDEMIPYLDALDMVHAAVPQLHPSAEEVRTIGLGEVHAPEQLGDFRIVREIGRGGMGIVYEAVQLSLGRRVALKVLPFAAALDSRQLQRFKNEAQAAAQLHHPHIVPVHAVGTERGVHYYAMQLIEGRGLDALIEAERRRAPASSPTAPTTPYRLPTAPPPLHPAPPTHQGAHVSTQRVPRGVDDYRTAAQQAAQAAEALHYAHSVGVVHRDVKPANLLVDDRGCLWVTDFGLAMFHADAGLTRTGDVVGTLRYMSPEQAGGQRVLVDHRTDVYSLGATLYEVLTLRPIFDGADHRAVLHQILHDEPRAPRAVDPAIPVELETIVLKAVAKLPSDRYATAQEFADDLERFARRERIQARRPTLIERAWKRLRRHPGILAASAALMVLLAAASLVAAWFVRGAYDREKHRAEQAEALSRLAVRPLDGMLEISEEEMLDRPDLQPLRKRLLHAALLYTREFIEQRGNDPDARAELDKAHSREETILASLAVLQGAEQTQLLNNYAVLEDLKLNPDKRSKIVKLAQSMDEEQKTAFRESRSDSPSERRKRFTALAGRFEGEVQKVLTEQERRRLKQIALQFQGLHAFSDPEIASALHLTAEQKERFRAFESEMFDRGPPRGRDGPGKKPPDGRGFGPGGPDPGRRGPGGPRPNGHKPEPMDPRGRGPKEFGREMDDGLEAIADKIRSVLTEEQQAIWSKLTGLPFKGPQFGPFEPR
jgi:serine/threonine protein kinase